MATGGHDGGAAGDGQGPYYDPSFPLPDDDALSFLNIPVSPDPPPPAAPVLPDDVTAGSSSGGDVLDWPPILGGGCTPVFGVAPTLMRSTVAAAPPNAAQDAGAGTSAMASSSSAAAHQNAVGDCTGCQVLREVLHSNGFEATKLSIHGNAGVFYHAMIEVYHINPEGLALALTNQSHIDLRGRDYVWVKHYLTDYAQQRATAGYAVVHDSISAFIDALCTSMTVAGQHVDVDRREGEAAAVATSSADQLQSFVAVPNAVQPDQQMIEHGNVPAKSGPSETSDDTADEQEQGDGQPAVRSAVAIQRERARKLELRDIALYFTLPIADAARELQVCVTALKSACRKCGVERWPHRKIKSIDRQIAKLRRGGHGGEAVRAEIERLADTRRKILAGLE
ncbi:hypothetical protein ACP70R_019889 [Stipagrostis hirtigluma subsp. patula]